MPKLILDAGPSAYRVGGLIHDSVVTLIANILRPPQEVTSDDTDHRDRLKCWIVYWTYLRLDYRSCATVKYSLRGAYFVS